MFVSGFTIVIMFVLVIYVQVNSTNQQQDPCSYVVIAANEDNCFAQYNLTDVFDDGLPSPISLSYSKSKMGTLCTHREDITTCIKSAMGSCNDAYFDYEAYRTTLLSICSNQEVLKMAETNCNFESVLEECLQYYHTAVINLKKQTYHHVTKPLLSEMCMIFKNVRECIHIDESETCRHRHSEFLTSLYRNRFMPAACNRLVENCSSPVVPWAYFTVSVVVFACFVKRGDTQCTQSNKRTTETLLVNETMSSFDTPGYRIAYFPSMDCRWIFDAGRDDATIAFDIQEVLIENSRNCNYDALEIYQGNDTTTRLRKICGRQTSSSADTFITVSGRYAMLRLKSDSSRQYAGANLNLFYAVENSGNACSGSSASITATLSSDYITSPGYPVSLATNLDCSWSITSDVSTVIYIEIEFTDMQYASGCPDTNLAIYDGTSSSDSGLVENWCDSRINFPTQSTVYYTTSNNAFIELTTSGTVTDRHGFRVNFRQNSSAITTTTLAPTTTTELVQVCSTEPVILEADNTTSKYFRSANYPNYYPHNINCFWRIVAPVGYMINLTFVDSDIQTTQPCTNADFVAVYDGESSSDRELDSFCGANSPSLLSTGRYLYIQFKTDPTVSFRGFSAQYSLESIVLPDCVVANLTGNYTVTDSAVSFSSPDYPNNYNSSIEVSWLLFNPNQTQAIVIDVLDSRIENSVDCIYDNVKIYQGPCSSYPVLSSFCGPDTPTIYYDTGAYALVVMTTDSTLTYRGFNMSVYLTDKPDEDETNILVVTGIIVGSVLGGLAVISAISFGAYKYLNRRHLDIPSRDSSRRSSSSSDSSDSSIRQRNPRMVSLKDKRFRLPPIKEFRA